MRRREGGSRPAAPAPALPPSTTRAQLVVRLVLAAAGVAALAVGARSAWLHLLDQWWPVLRWATGGVLVHDLLLAPLALLLGVLVLRRVPPGWRDPLRGALLGLATAAVLVLPLLQSPARRWNTTILPTPGGVSVLVAVLVPLAGALIAVAVGRRRASRSR